MPKMEVDITVPPPEPPYSDTIFGRLLIMARDLTTDDEDMSQAPPADISASASANIHEAEPPVELESSGAIVETNMISATNEAQGPSEAEEFLENDPTDHDLEEAIIHNNNMNSELESLDCELVSQGTASGSRGEKIKKILLGRPGPRATQHRIVRLPRRTPVAEHLIRNAPWNKGKRG